MMKRILILCALFALPACSKSESVEPTVKTVDLGEVQADQAKDSETKGNGGKKSRRNRAERQAAKDAADGKTPDSATKTDSTGPVMNMEGRGKPAAELEFEEQQAAAKAAKDAASPPKDADQKTEQAAQNAPTPEDDQNGFDFSNDSDEKLAEQPNIRHPKVRSGLDIEKIITLREFREQTGYAGVLSESWLAGQEPDARYSSARLATANTSDLGFALQIWRPGNESAASKRFDDLFHQSFGGKKIKSVATDAFTASHHQMHEVGFFEKGKRATVLLSCSASVCTADQLREIALIIQRRL